MSSALVRIFNAIPSPPFSAAAELRISNPNLRNFILCLSGSLTLFCSRAQYILADNMGTSHLGIPYIIELIF
jgi:hypothetical protein